MRVSVGEIISEFQKKYNVELYGRTIENFFWLYDIKMNYGNIKIIPSGITRSSRFEPQVRTLIFENADLIIAFHKEFYEKAYTLEGIAKITGFNIDVIKRAVKKHFHDPKFQHLLAAKYFARNIWEIPNESAVWNITINHIIKYISGTTPKLLKTLEEISNNQIEEKNGLVDKKPNEFKNIVGYGDYISFFKEQLDPIMDFEDAKRWGLDFPGGILLYGPPGCGKTFWAKEIANYLNYHLKEVPRSLFGSTYVDGAMNNLKNLLEDIKNESKIMLFFDEFDSIASERKDNSAGSTENSKVVNTLLQEIPELIKRNIMVVGASNFINKLDPAVIRPGRFDIKIPVFPPNPNERLHLLLNELIKDLPVDSPLLIILSKNDANKVEYWEPFMSNLDLFSASLIVDVAKNLKKKIKLYYNNISTEVRLTKEIILEIINLTRSKLTDKDVEYYSNFYEEIKTSPFSNELDQRKKQLYEELNAYYKGKKDPPRPIGFRLPDIP